MILIEHQTTADMDDGQPLPPLIEDGIAWYVVCRANNQTKWRRIFLKKSSATIHAQGHRARECF